jgi:hypothetical protein
MSGGPDRTADSSTRGPQDDRDAGALQRIEGESAFDPGVQELARAFQMNAEALLRIQQTQDDIARTLDRSDRSDMVIKSADSLNETFRGVRSSQKALMDRIEETRSRGWRTVLIVGLASVLALAGLLLGARWLVETTQQETRSEVAGAWKEDRQARDRALEDAGRIRSELETARLDLLRLEKEQESALADLSAAREAEREVRGRLAALETLPRRLEEMSADIRVREDRLAERDVRIAALNKELVGLRLREGELTAQLAASEESVGDLRSAVARNEGLVVPDGKPEIPSDGVEIPPEALTNQDSIARLLTVLNRLLSQASGDEHYRFEKVKGVSGRQLLGVEVRNHGFGVRLEKVIRADRCTISLDSGSARVEIRFEGGAVWYSGAPARFYENRYVVRVTGIDVAAWKRAGLTVLEPR